MGWAGLQNGELLQAAEERGMDDDGQLDRRQRHNCQTPTRKVLLISGVPSPVSRTRIIYQK
jgi:hypothetical protein